MLEILNTIKLGHKMPRIGESMLAIPMNPKFAIATEITNVIPKGNKGPLSPGSSVFSIPNQNHVKIGVIINSKKFNLTLHIK